RHQLPARGLARAGGRHADAPAGRLRLRRLARRGRDAGLRAAHTAAGWRLRPRPRPAAAGRGGGGAAGPAGRGREAPDAGRGHAGDCRGRERGGHHRLRGADRAARRAAGGGPPPGAAAAAGGGVGRGLHGARRPAGAHPDRARGGAGGHRHGAGGWAVLPAAAPGPRRARRARSAGGERARVSVELRGVSAAYPQAGGALRPVLAGVSLRLAPGEVVGVPGPNGAGKSPLLRLLTRRLTPTAGSVTVDGRALASYGRFQLARALALVEQAPVVPAGFLVREVVAMGRTPHLGLFGTPGRADEAVVEAALAATDTARFAERRVETLSGGELQRV